MKRTKIWHHGRIRWELTAISDGVCVGVDCRQKIPTLEEVAKNIKGGINK